MKAKRCPICGEATLVEKQGEYRMDLPPNIPGDAAVVPNAKWMHCKSCGEDILSAELEKAINNQCSGRKVSRVG